MQTRKSAEPSIQVCALVSYKLASSLKESSKIRANWKKMAGLKGLVDTSASCGNANPLMKLTTHFSGADHAKSDLLGRQITKGTQ